MKLKLGRFILKPDPVAIWTFDLYEATEATAKEDGQKYKKGEKYKAEYNIAYGVTLGRAIEIISSIEISNTNIDDVKTYITAKELRIKQYLRSLDKLGQELYKKK